MTERLSKWLSMGQKSYRIARHDGNAQLARRAIRYAYHKYDVAKLEFPLSNHDIVDVARLSLLVSDDVVPRTKHLRVGWVTSPPGLGSGGHTTMFRMVEALEAKGHTCTIIVCDRYRGSVVDHEAVIRRGWPAVRAEVRDIGDGLANLDACVATSWPTAHILASRSRHPMRYFYLVQDYEPLFYPSGWERCLAQDTYRFGFRCMTVGFALAQLLKEEVGVESIPLEFGRDTSTYNLQNSGLRSGVVFYSRPNVPRRGYALGIATLAEFHQIHPEHDIHIFGGMPHDVAFPFIYHGRLEPSELNQLYNRTIAGLALSFTNISLVPDEMLAAGNIPVLNRFDLARQELGNPYAVWAQSTPGSLADAMCEVVEHPRIAERAIDAARSVDAVGWTVAERRFVETIEGELYGDDA